LTFSDQQDGNCCAVAALTEQHLAQVEQKLRDLNLLKERLSHLLVSCGWPICRLPDY